MSRYARNAVLLLIVLISMAATAQDTKETLPLRDILDEVSETYGFRFNYALSTLEGVEAHRPQAGGSLEEVLAFLSEETGLQFTLLPGNFISVTPGEIPICGFLKAGDTGAPLPFATIQAGNSSAISDENGYFEMEVGLKSDVVIIEYLGYREIQSQAGLFSRGDCQTLFMFPEEQQLSEIVLYDYLIRGIDQLGDGSYRIDFNRFSILPGLVETDVLQAVQAFPGIQSVSETVSDLNIRGGTNDQNLLTWDGIKMYQSGHFFGLISMFNPMITQKVSLRKNGTPASFTDGVSGTIGMETDQELSRDFSGSIGLNFIDVSGFVDTPVGTRSSVQIAARKAISDFVETPTYNEYFSRISQDTEVENNSLNVNNSAKSFDFYDTSLRWLWEPGPKDQVRVNFIHASNSLQFNENAILGSTLQTRESGLTQNSIAGGLEYRRQWGSRISTQVQLYNTDYELQAINANIENDQRFLQENKVSETGARVSATYTYGTNWQWTSGYQFIETKVTNLDDVDNPIFVRLNSEVLRIHSGFTSLGFNSNQGDTKLQLGLRFNYLDKFRKQIWEPRVSFNQRFLQWFNLEVLGEFKHQNTSQVINFQNDFLGIEKRRWQLSNNADIPVIQGKQGSVGLSFNKSGWLVNLVGFAKEVEGITAQSQGFQNQYEFRRDVGSYQASGLDLLLRKQFRNASTWLSYSYLTTDYSFENLEERTFTSNYEIAHTVTLGLSYEWDRLRFAGGLNWHSGKPFTAPDPVLPVDNNQVNFGPSNTDQLPDYLRVDVSSTYQFSLGTRLRGHLGVSVWNVLDRENIINAFYRPDLQGGVQEFLQGSLGITPNMVARIFF